MKIKQIRHVNLHELIKWVWENEKEDLYHAVNNRDVRIEMSFGDVNTNFGDVPPAKKHLFEIEEEIDVTHDTTLDMLLEMFLDSNGKKCVVVHKNSTVNNVLEGSYSKNKIPLAVHYVQDDGNTVTLWEKRKNPKKKSKGNEEL